MKETERMKAVTTELRKLGATVEEGEDYLVVDPPQKILPCEIETYDAVSYTHLTLPTN